MATRIRHIPGVIRSARMLWPQLITADGLIGYSLYADLTGRTLETLTVWRDRASMTAFVRGRQHTALVDRTRHRIRDSGTSSWTVRGTDLPPSWRTARERLDQTTTNNAVRNS